MMPPTADAPPVHGEKQTTSPPLRAATAPSRPGGRALVCLLVVVTCVTTAELLLKRGAVSAHETAADGLLKTLGFIALVSPFTIVGIVFHLLGMAAWMYTLRTIPLIVAYCFTAVQQATIALGAWYFLGESIPPLRWAGIACVLTGVLVLVPTIVHAEQESESASLPEAQP
jgi:multidrug transporter EmrE-like cation transporter